MTITGLKSAQFPKLHVAILMDGNGRWALRRGLARSEGHRAGVAAVHRVVRAAASLGIGTLTLYAFSSDNWGRPAGEVASLFGLLEDYLRNEGAVCAREGIRLRIIGRRDRIPRGLVAAIESAERLTASGRALDLRPRSRAVE
jgi:undecaprenyl diphosphate synthase